MMPDSNRQRCDVREARRHGSTDGWRQRSIGAVVLLIGLASPTSGQPARILFDRITVDQGLSQNRVGDILQDRRGFMWFATEDGLNRFDGYEFRIFKHDPQDPTSLPPFRLWVLHEDDDGTLWVGSDGGLSRFDPDTGTATNYRNDPSQPGSLSNDRVRALFRDRSGALWIGTTAGLNRLQPGSESFDRFHRNPANPNSLSNDHIRSIAEDDEGTLWLGTWGGGLNRFDGATGTFSHFRHQPDNPSSLSADVVSALHVSRSGEVWIATNRGLDRLDSASGTFEHFRHDPQDPTSLSHDDVNAITEDAEGTLWVGTDDGLNRWDPESRRFQRFQHDPADPTSLSDDSILAFYQDRGGILWIGTLRGGLNRWNTSTGFFPHFRSKLGDPSTLRHSNVVSFAEDPDGTLWIGTLGGGLHHFDLQTGVLHHYAKDEASPESLHGNSVMALLVDRRGTLWVGTRRKGLHRFSPKDRSFARYARSGSGGTSSSGIMTLHEDRDGMIWIGTYQGGLNRLDPETETFIHFRHDRGDATTVSSDIVTSIYEDEEGILWVGTEGGGLNRFDRARGTFTYFKNDPGDSQSLSSDLVLDIHEDGDGSLWIGTYGGGLNRWAPADRRAHRGVFERYTTDEGLPNDVVYGILEDGKGKLWLSTNRGLSKLDPSTGTFRNYDTRQGIQSHEFNFGSAFKTSNGHLLFGGINGFNAFDPESIQINRHRPPVVLTKLLKLNQPVPLDQPFGPADVLELSYRDYAVSFELAALDYTAPEKNRYATKLEPLDEAWIELGTLRRATYTNLKPGEYFLKVRGSNNDGVWSEEQVALKLSVQPPPWKSWWAYSLYTLAIAGAFYSYARGQARKLERQAKYQEELELEVAERTRELAERNEQLEEANRSLEEASLTDALTGLRNRRFVVTHIEEEVALVERRHEAQRKAGLEPLPGDPDFLFLMLDLDGLKQINDRYGHSAGDQLLRQVCQVLETICRKSDTVVRWGGDEFLIVGRGANPDSAEQLAERVRDAIASREFEIGHRKPVRLSCSLGFAFYPFVPSEPNLLTWEQVLAVADRALYGAKKSGKNSWVGILSDKTPPPPDFFDRVYHSPAELAEDGWVVIRTSRDSEEELVWAM